MKNCIKEFEKCIGWSGIALNLHSKIDDEVKTADSSVKTPHYDTAQDMASILKSIA